MLPPEALKEFREIYRHAFGVELDDKTALELGVKLLVIMKAIYKPVPEETVLKE